MIRAMELKNLSHHTQRANLAAVTGIARFYNQSPDKMPQEKIEDYLLISNRIRASLPTVAAVFLPDFVFSTNA